MFVAKTRNGFTPKTKAAVAARCPFAHLPEPKSARRGLALTAVTLAWS